MDSHLHPTGPLKHWTTVSRPSKALFSSWESKTMQWTGKLEPVRVALHYKCSSAFPPSPGGQI